MADQKISALTDLSTSVVGGDTTVVVDATDTTTKKASVTNLVNGAIITGITNPYKMKAYRNSALNMTAEGKVALDAESWDPNNNFATGTYTVPVTGYYHVVGMFSSSTANSATQAKITKTNGGNTTLAAGQFSGVAVGAICIALVVADLYLTAADTIELFAYVSINPTVVQTGASNTYLSINLFGV